MLTTLGNLKRPRMICRGADKNRHGRLSRRRRRRWSPSNRRLVERALALAIGTPSAVVGGSGEHECHDHRDNTFMNALRINRVRQSSTVLRTSLDEEGAAIFDGVAAGNIFGELTLPALMRRRARYAFMRLH